jgi:hypothetical protein
MPHVSCQRKVTINSSQNFLHILDFMSERKMVSQCRGNQNKSRIFVYDFNENSPSPHS